MATRINKKNAPTTSPKEVVTAEKASAKNEPPEPVAKSSGTAKSIGKRIAKKPIKKIGKRSLGVKLKAKVQKLKLNPLAKAALQNAPKKKLLKNGVKEVKPRKRKYKLKTESDLKKEPEDAPPVLEPIFPLEENVLGKRGPKKRVKKIIKNEAPELIECAKIKQENDQDPPSDVTDVSFNDLPSLSKQVKKTRVKKQKIDNETLEDVMNDLTYLIKAEDIKKEVVDTVSESDKSDSATKPKKLTKKQKIELLKKKMIKKENIENTLSKLDSADEKIIDMLDLNVNMLKKKSPITNRRHSIEKCPIGPVEAPGDTIKVFSHLPRSISPRAKRKGKQDSLSRRSSPYSTRSDSPARILRNGKQRKLKDMGLLEGLDLEFRKRRRLCSDSGSKLSGYESDSSFSDLASLHGTESNEATKCDDKDIKPSISTASNGPIDSLGLIDSNSNIYSNAIIETTNVTEDSLSDKNVLLDIMKQTFNNEVDLKKTGKFKVGTVVASRFYGRRTTGTSQVKPETILKEEIKEKIAAPVMDDNCSAVTEDLAKTNDEIGENKQNLTDNSPVFKDDSQILTDDSQILTDGSLILTDDSQVLIDNSQNLTDNLQNITNNSEITTDLPEITTDLPEITTDLPKITTDLPKITTDLPKITTDLPETTIDLPKITTDLPKITTDSPKITTDLPKITTDLPKITTDLPEISTVKPEIVKEDLAEPMVTSEDVACENIESMEEDETVQKSCIPEPMECEDLNIVQPIIENFVEKELPLKIEPLIEVPDKVIEPEPPAVIEEATTELIDTNVNNVETESVVTENITNNVDTLNESIPYDSLVIDSESIPTLEDQIPGPSTSTTENSNAVIENIEDLNAEVESAEQIAEKESILKALGLQRSSQLAEEAKQKTKEKFACVTGDSYTGTLKTVIKINRDKKKGGRGSIKSSGQKSKVKSNPSTEDEQVVTEETKEKGSKEKEISPSWKQGTQSSDTAGAHRKSHYSNRSNLDGSSEHTSDGEAAPPDGAIKALVIPEKASSFSIHPGRLCKDECSYCFGKFGLFDTPCHIAQMKSVDRQNKILATEKHLTRDSCLCDACYRHVDRKSNTPSYMNKSMKRNSLVAPGPRQNHCHVLGCHRESSNILRRKWIIKMRKSICQVINLDLDNPGLHSIPICEDHYAALEHLMICAMCKRRLARNHIHYLGPETVDLNNALNANSIPLTLNDKPVVCKLCKCFASIILKDPSERPEASKNFFVEYKRRLLHFNDIVPMDESAAEEPIAVPSKADRMDMLKRKKKMMKSADENTEDEHDGHEKRGERVPSTDTNSQPQSRSESPNDDYNGVDYNTLIPAIAMEEGSDSDSKKDSKTPVNIKKFNEMQREGVEIVRVAKNERPKSESVLKKFGYGPSVSVRQLFPGEEDLPLVGSVDFNNVKEKTVEGWEKCSTVIQYDEETKRLWQELQKPYGNQSSFLRHLILLEKYFRNGDLVLSPRASHHSINYSESVHNRLRAYDNIPTSAGNIQPLSMLPFNKSHTKSSSGIITSNNIPQAMSNSIPTQAPSAPSTTITNSKPVGTTAMSVTSLPSIPKGTPITISQLNSPPLLPSSAILQPLRPKMVGQPPGLISLHPGTGRPVAPLVKVPQPQKIKFPITKNWRPNLIPIDPNKKLERKTGLVQVISGGKPYHITLEDYKKMCAIKRSFEMKQKRLQEAQAPKPILVTHNSVLKSIIPRKGLVISKTATVSAPSIKTEPSTPGGHLGDGVSEGENILDKLDKQVEKLESKLNEKPSSLLLPRIPKSLTVIPQTITRRPDRPSSPVLLITSKNSSTKS